jgi:Ca2+-binding EF-hand superfamily protein
MKFYRILFIIGIVLLSTFPNISPAQAEQPEVYDSPSDIPDALMRMLRMANYEEQYVFQALATIRQNAADYVSLSASDLKVVEEKKVQGQRQRQVQSLMRYDTDVDGKITRDEVEQSLSSSRHSKQTYKEDAINKTMQADLDKDDVLTREEIVKFADQELKELSKKYKKYNRQGNQLEDILDLDPNNDKKLTVDELKSLAIKAFRTVDSDGNGILSEDEKKIVQEINNERQKLARIISPDCTFPRPEEDEKVVFIGVYEGKAVSTISVAGQVSETNVIPVQIDKGDEKLYIITSASSPVIWQFEGETDRVSKLLLTGPSMPPGTDNNDSGGDKINVGATGVAADKITFRHASECGAHSAYDKNKKQQALAALEKLLGRQPDLFFSEYGVIGLHIFGERINTDISEEIKEAQKEPPKGFEANLWKSHIRFMPGGVIDLKNEKIVSDSPAVPYEVLPKWAGFSKLAYEGAISHVSGPNRVKIVKDIPYYPSGLYGGYLAEILIGKGVEPPKGSAGHSNITLEETGELIAGPLMHRK